MASKEFILKRIAGKEAEISKLTKKLERIEKAEASGWENNPYYYDECDKRYTLKDIAEAKEALLKYQEELNKAEEMEASRNVPAITEFLNRWYDNCVEYFISEKALYEEALKEFYQKSNEHYAWWNNGGYRLPKEDRNKIDEEYREYRKNFTSAWSHVTQFDHGSLDWESTMKKDLKDEYNRKYDFIINRTNEIVGQITDASHLRIGAKHDLNGYNIGTRGCCSLKTIGAGGYNIQCFHFRTLIHPYTPPKTASKTSPKPTKVSPDMSFKGMSIEELKAVLSQVGGECKTYSDPKIYKMRLIMSIKKAI